MNICNEFVDFFNTYGTLLLKGQRVSEKISNGNLPSTFRKDIVELINFGLSKLTNKGYTNHINSYGDTVIKNDEVMLIKAIQSDAIEWQLMVKANNRRFTITVKREYDGYVFISVNGYYNYIESVGQSL